MQYATQGQNLYKALHDNSLDGDNSAAARRQPLMTNAANLADKAQCLPVPQDAQGKPAIHYTTVYRVFANSKGGTSCWNSSSILLVKSRNSVGRDCISVNREPAMERASCYGIVLSEAHHIIHRDKLKSMPKETAHQVTFRCPRSPIA
jgi:hypothetical protein